MDYAKESLKLHYEWKGKIAVKTKTHASNRDELDGANETSDGKRYADDDIIEVAISAVDAVFEWREYLIKEFGYDRCHKNRIYRRTMGVGDNYDA